MQNLNSKYFILLLLFTSINVFGQNTVFWTEGNLQKFYSISGDGTGEQLLLEDTISLPDNVVFFNSKIFYSEDGILKSLNEDGSNLNDLIIRNASIKSLIIDTGTSRIYWAESTIENSYIYSSNLNGSDIQLIFEHIQPSENITNLAMNESSGLLYFSSNDRIYRLNNNNGTVSASIIEENYSNIKTIHIDANSNKLIWYERWEDHVYISNLDGTDKDTLIFPGFNELSEDIFIDETNDIIYWLNRRDFRIHSIDYNGEEGEQLMTLGWGNDINASYSIYYDFDLEKLFWSSTDELIASKGKDDSSTNILLEDTYGVIQSIWVDVPTAKVYLRHNGIWSFDVNGTQQQEVLTDNGTYSLHQVHNEYIYYLEGFSTIKRIRTNGTGSEIITDNFPAGATSMFVDYESEYIYFTGQFCDCVKRFYIPDEEDYTLYPGTDVRNINLDKEDLRIFWTDYDSSSGLSKIYRGRSFGIFSEDNLYSTNNYIQDLTIDKALKKIFWIERAEGNGIIYSMNYDGSDLIEITTTMTIPRSIGVYGVYDLDNDGFDSVTDCDDNNPNINPDAIEVIYNGIDDDCDPTTLDNDLDQDGFNIPFDCDDNNPDINPFADEIPFNGIDDDCDSATLDNDGDQDGFDIDVDCNDLNHDVNPDAMEIVYNGLDDDCDPSTLDDDLDQDGYPIATDCDDTDPDIFPNAVEIPFNGIDDDCNPSTLDNDGDFDGYGDDMDCNDMDASVNPGASEIVYNGVDDDCNETTLDDDLDQDGFDLADDCNDDDATINPDAEDIVNNGIDEDCDGMDAVSSTSNITKGIIKIFPNPSKGVFNLISVGNETISNNIVDMHGKTLFTSDARSIDMSTYPDGIYFIRCTINDTELKIYKIILNK